MTPGAQMLWVALATVCVLPSILILYIIFRS